jgi:hypothetical protein
MLIVPPPTLNSNWPSRAARQSVCRNFTVPVISAGHKQLSSCRQWRIRWRRIRRGRIGRSRIGGRDPRERSSMPAPATAQGHRAFVVHREFRIDANSEPRVVAPCRIHVSIIIALTPLRPPGRVCCRTYVWSYQHKHNFNNSLGVQGGTKRREHFRIAQFGLEKIRLCSRQTVDGPAADHGRRPNSVTASRSGSCRTPDFRGLFQLRARHVASSTPARTPAGTSCFSASSETRNMSCQQYVFRPWHPPARGRPSRCRNFRRSSVMCRFGDPCMKSSPRVRPASYQDVRR